MGKDTLELTNSHHFCIPIFVHQKKKLKASRFIFNYLQFLDENKTIFNEAIFSEKRQLVELLVENYKNEQYDEIFRLCCHELNASDWLKAEEYFKYNPGKVYCGAKNGLLYSYIKTDNAMIRRQHELGIGNFGRVKTGITYLDPAQPSAIKRQTLDTSDPYNSRHWLEAVKKEAAVNLDVGIALSDLVIRTNNDGNVYKVYQDMRYLGKPLLSVVSNIDPAYDRNRVGYAILLLSQVFKLHSGSLANSGKKYTHRDIKPDNIVIDEHNALHLIDFAMATDEHLLDAHYACSGTKQYMPFNMASSGSSLRMSDTVEMTPSLFFDDKIAVLRTIYHPCEKGIFTTEIYEHLPLPLQSLLSTQDIQQCVRADEQHSLKIILSSFIFYVENSYSCSAEELQELANNPPEQDRLILKLQEDASFQAGLFLSMEHGSSAHL